MLSLRAVSVVEPRQQNPHVAISSLMMRLDHFEQTLVATTAVEQQMERLIQAAPLSDVGLRIDLAESRFGIVQSLSVKMRNG